MKKFRIDFVCLGNICRSPMAEFVASKIIRERGITNVEVFSSATSCEEEGNPVDYRALATLKMHGVPTYPHYANVVTADTYDRYDMFVGMEEYNVRKLRGIFGGDTDGKVVRLLDFTDNPRDIADPWYNGRFDVVYDQIVEGVTALLDSLQTVN